MAVGWGNKTWGEETWGDLSNATASPSGISATTSIGSSTTQANANVDVTGSQLTFTNAGAVAGSSVQFSVTGIQLTSSIGEEDIARGIQQNVTGSQLTSTPGTVTIDDQFLIGSGWGRDAWGSMVWGDAYSVQTGSVSATMSIGAVAEVTAGASANLTGQELTATPGQITMTGDANVDVTGIQATLSIGQIQGLSVIGSQMAMSIQTVDVEAGGSVSVNPIEDNLDSFIGSVGVDISFSFGVTGSELTSSIGDETVTGTANVELTNFSGPKFSAQGNAQLSTAQQKFGSASLLLDGTDDSVDSTSNLDLSSTDFTVDVWIRPDNVTGYKGIWQSGTSTTEQSYLLGNQVYWTINPSTIITTSVTVSAGVWTMLSYERQGNTHRIYKNGTLEDTATTGNKQDNGPFTIGKNGFGDFDGYIDEVRVSDIARYTGSSFTEPTSEFSVDSDTIALLHFDGADGSTDMINAVNEQSLVLETNIGEETVVADGNVSVTGLELTSFIGEETVTADANVTVTGIELTSSIGEVEQNTIYDVTGSEMTMFIGEETPIANANVDVIGITLTGSVGNINTTSWQEINLGVNNVWTEVDLAA
jgi:hypothetical protein